MALLHIASRRRKGSADSVHKIAGHLIEYRDVASHRIASHRIASHRIASHRIASHRSELLLFVSLRSALMLRPKRRI